MSRSTKDVSYTLGQFSRKTFIPLFDELDKQNVQYGFVSGSLREVFIKISDETEEDSHEQVEIMHE